MKHNVGENKVSTKSEHETPLTNLEEKTWIKENAASINRDNETEMDK